MSDITEIEAKDGKLYIAGVLGCRDEAIVGLSMDGNMKAELYINAMEIALHRYALQTISKDKQLNLIAHSDRGS